MQARRCQARELDQGPRASALGAVLQRFSLLDGVLVALERVSFGHMQWDEQRRQVIAQVQLLCRRTDVDRDLPAAGLRGPAAGSSSPRSTSRLRSPPAHSASATSLTVPPRLALIALKSSSVNRRARKRRVAPIGTLRLDFGGGYQLVAHQDPGHGLCAAGQLQQLLRMESDVDRRAAPVPEHPWRSPPRQARAAARSVRLASIGRPDRRSLVSIAHLEAGIRRRVEQQLPDVDSADAVDQAMVNLAHHRPAALREALEQRHLPQRPSSVKAMGVEVRDPVKQLLVAARRGQRGTVDVVGDVEALDRLPRGPVQAAPVRVEERRSLKRGNCWRRFRDSGQPKLRPREHR